MTKKHRSISFSIYSCALLLKSVYLNLFLLRKVGISSSSAPNWLAEAFSPEVAEGALSATADLSDFLIEGTLSNPVAIT